MAGATCMAELEVPLTDETVIAQRDAAFVLLRDVMLTLAHVSPEPRHRALYDRAYAAIAEAGLSFDPDAEARHAMAYAAWEASRR